MKWRIFFGAIWRGIKLVVKSPAVRDAVVSVVAGQVMSKVKDKDK